MKNRAYNFSAGPAILPEPVLRAAQPALWNLDNSGVGILEHSHRGAQFTKIMADAQANIRQLAAVPDNYEILFLQGGASSQFFMVPMNFLGGNNDSPSTADYIDTGAWSTKAIKEAQRFGAVFIAGSSKENGFTHIPHNLSHSEKPVYLHFTSNNTIFGTQFATEPTPPEGAFLVCDASSDIFCRPINVSKYGVIYAGAQKNLGPAGLTLVIIRKDLIERAATDLPTMLQYRTHATKGSAFNTPPTFPIYIVGEVVKWLLDRGGLAAVERDNRNKAALLYDFLDKSSMFNPTAATDSRSLMNVCFRAGGSSADEDLEKKFITEAAEQGFKGLKGHRSVGGMRASIYNAFPATGIGDLVNFMSKFERANGQ